MDPSYRIRSAARPAQRDGLKARVEILITQGSASLRPGPQSVALARLIWATRVVPRLLITIFSPVFTAALAAAVCSHATVTAQPVFHLFGSAVNEAHWTPAAKESPLNPGNFLNLQSRSDSSDITLFGEMSPEDKRWKFHLKLRASGEWNRNSTSSINVSELYWNISITPWLDVQVGRNIEKWGTGYAWNPTGVVNPPKNPADPNDRRSAYRGVDNARVDLFVKEWNVSLLAVPEIDWEGKRCKHLLSTGWATRAYRLIKGVDLSLSASGG